MKEFCKIILSSSDEGSHKRLISIGSFLVLIGMMIANGCHVIFNDIFIYVFASLTCGESILTVVEKFKKS